MYLQIEGSDTVHSSEIGMGCFYFARSAVPSKDGTMRDYRIHDRKPPSCSVCDECQRIARRKGRPKAK